MRTSENAPFLRTPVNKAPSGPRTILFSWATVREIPIRVHTRHLASYLWLGDAMMDRNASGRMDRGPEGAQAEWLGAMRSLAEQIQKQQQASQRMIQELMNTY